MKTKRDEYLLMPKHTVDLLVREGCGSCVRMGKQIMPILTSFNVDFSVIDVDQGAHSHSSEFAAEFGDRLPVILLDGEEFACWEVDNDDLIEALSR